MSGFDISPLPGVLCIFRSAGKAKQVAEAIRPRTTNFLETQSVENATWQVATERMWGKAETRKAAGFFFVEIIATCKAGFYVRPQAQFVVPIFENVR